MWFLSEKRDVLVNATTGAAFRLIDGTPNDSEVTFDCHGDWGDAVMFSGTPGQCRAWIEKTADAIDQHEAVIWG